jgi:hypothetical protein
MKKLLFIGIVLLCLNNEIYSQEEYNKCCNVNIFLDIEYLGSIPIYEGSNGNILAFLKHDIENENFIQFKILKKNKTMFYVYVYKSQNEDQILLKGWIKKGIHLGVYSRAYEKDLILYKDPKEESEIVCREKYETKMYEVIDCQKGWLKIKTTINGKIYEGWISPKMQCANVYSTCS